MAGFSKSGKFRVMGLTKRGKTCPDDFVGTLSDIRACPYATPPPV
jgi:hypothetical protein